MTQTILVPTDFSNNSLTATHYALELAQIMHADIHILHAYRPFTSAFQSLLANESDEQRAQIGAEKGLADFVQTLGQNSRVNITAHAVQNNLLEAVEAYTAKNNVSLVVMGTRGASGIRKDLLGSNTYDLAKHIAQPMLVVPEHAPPFKLDKVVFFSDYQERDIKTLRGLQSLFGEVSPAICTLVHIHECSAPTEAEQKELEEWQSMLAAKTAFNNLTAELVHVQENVDSVNEILERLQADLTLLTLVGGRNFFKRLFQKSLAREIILNPKTPVLLTGGVE